MSMATTKKSTVGSATILLGLCLFHSGCTLMVKADRQQCENDGDCARHGAAYSHYTCDKRFLLCVAPAGSGGQVGDSTLPDDVGGGSGGEVASYVDGGLAAAGGSQTGGSPFSGDAGSGSGGATGGHVDGGFAAAGGSRAADGSLDSSHDAPAAGGYATGGSIGSTGGNSGGASSQAGSGGSAGGSTTSTTGGTTTGGTTTGGTTTGGTTTGGITTGGTTTGGTATGGTTTGGTTTGGTTTGGATTGGATTGGTTTGGTTTGGITTVTGGNPGSGGSIATGGGPGTGGDSGSGGSAMGGTGGTSSAPDGGAPDDAGGTGSVDAMHSSATVVSLSLGTYHTCAVTSAGGVWCWGDDTYGQVGDGAADTIGRYAPLAVPSLSSGVAAVSAGANHTCALTSAGGVWCWGLGTSGQLGDGSTSTRTTPVSVDGLSTGVAAVAAGTDHTCALLSGGGVRCWGDNSFGQLGLGGGTSRTVPVDVPGLSNVLSISSGSQFTCAALAAEVWCWGRGDSGQLGSGGTTNKITPARVLDGFSSGVSSISAGRSHACAVLNAGGVKCWGDNFYDQLGKGTSSSSELKPVDVAGLSFAEGRGPVASVAAGSGHTCALLRTGGLMCWGANTVGQLGLGADNNYQLSPVSVPEISGASMVAAGGMISYGHTCAALAAGGIECWGYNVAGQVGCGQTNFEERSPVPVSGL